MMNVFHINDQVVHFREGLVLISEEKEMEGVKYFIVQPLQEGGEKIYVPVDRVEQVLRPVIDKKEVEELAVYMKGIKPEVFSNTKQRRDVFKRRLGSGDIKDLAYLTMLLYYFRHPGEIDTPVKFGPADVEMLKHANRTLYDELAVALHVNRDEVEEVVMDMVRKG